jgi:hypothetical protein
MIRSRKKTNLDRHHDDLYIYVKEGWEYFWSRPHRVDLPNNPLYKVKDFNFARKKKKKSADT